MARRILVVPVNHGAGVTVACLGLVHALESRHVSVGFCKPFAQARGLVEDHSTELFRLATSLRPPEPIKVDELESRIALGRLGSVMAKVVELTSDLDSQHQVLVLEGLAATAEQVYADRMNIEIARAVDADVLLVGAVGALSPERFAERAAAVEQIYRSRGDSRVIGVVANRLPLGLGSDAVREALEARQLPCVAVIEDHAEFTRPRMADIVRELRLEVLSGTDLDRRVANTVIAAQAVPGFIPSLQEGTLIVAPGDRHEVLLSVALAEASDTKLAGLLLTAGIRPHEDVMRLVGPALEGGMPLLLTEEKTFPTATEILSIDPDIPADDEERAKGVMQVLGDAYDDAFLGGLPRAERPVRTTPAQFAHRLLSQMRKGHVRLAIADGEDTRVLQALRLLQRYDALQMTLIADPARVDEKLADMGLRLPMAAHVVDPGVDGESAAAIRAELAAKGVSFDVGDPLLCALALLRDGKVDGVLGGIEEDRGRFLDAVQTAIPLGSGVRVLSSSQATMLPDEVVFFADGLINPHPTAEQLAAIAEQTADMARMCGIAQHVTFVAPSSSSPTAHHDRQVIAAARAMLAEKRPDLRTSGPEPFQHASRRTRSAEGDATVFVFPDVASAAASAKAIGQSGGATVHPPVLQGLSKAVNMLPRDASVDSLMDLIVATAVHAGDLG